MDLSVTPTGGSSANGPGKFFREFDPSGDWNCHERRRDLVPEVALRVALIGDAVTAIATGIRHLRSGRPYDAELAREAQTALRWIMGADALITFREACEAVGFDEGYLRMGILKMTSKMSTDEGVGIKPRRRARPSV